MDYIAYRLPTILQILLIFNIRLTVQQEGVYDKKLDLRFH